jgi:UDP-glucose 4-epimerase
MLLITGGLGYIGSHAIVALEKEGLHCCIIDNLSNADIWVHQTLEKLTWSTIPCYIGDIADQQLLEEIFSEHSIEGVIHFAWYKAVEESCHNPFEYYHNNIIWTIKLLEVMEENVCRKIVFSSSATVYDMSNPDKREYTEGDSCWKCSNPYGTTKFLLENIIEDLTKHKQRSAISLRYFNPIGADRSWELGENPAWIPNNLFPHIFKVLNGSLKELTIFGSDYDTRDWTCERDYIDILDLVAWHSKAWKYLAEQSESYYDIFNLGTGKWRTVLEAIKAIEDSTWIIIPKRFWKRRKWDKTSFYANTNKAEKILSRKSKTTMEVSIKNTWNYIKKAI